MDAILFKTYKGSNMKVKEGDILVCHCSDCKIELTVTKACSTELCGHDVECNVEASCCGKPMIQK